MTVPTKTGEHDGSHGSRKKSGKKHQQRLMRQDIYGSDRSHDSDDVSRSSSIGSLSECLDVLARSSTKTGDHVDGEKIKIETILAKTKHSGRRSKQGYHRIPTNSSRCSADSDGDLSFVSGFSDWNEMVEKTFECDDLHSEMDGSLLDNRDKHVSDSQNNGEDKSCCSRGGDPPGGRDDSRYRVGVGHPTSAPMISPPATTARIPAPKSILKVKESHTMAAGTEGANVHAHFDELHLVLDHSLKTSCNDSDSECFSQHSESKGNDTEKKRNIENSRLSSSMGDIYDMMEGLFTGDEIADRQSFECEQQKRSDASERAQNRLRKKKAALHTKVLHDSVQSKPAAHSPRKPRSRSNSYDDADSFLSSLEEARAELNKSKMSDNTNDQRQEVINFPGPRTRSVHQSSVKSLDAFDHMLAEIEEEERRMESALFDSKPKSRRREHEHLPKMSYKRGVTQDTHPSYYHQSASSPPTKVICLKWVDRRGMVGHYTGQVNSMIQPHGRGILVYENGLVLDCNWCNGSPSTGMDGASTAAAASPQKRAPSDENRSKQFHPDYDLGMPARSHDMKDEDPDKALKGISCLKKFDFAFVRRSNEQWTYSIISDRTDDCIRFVVDEVGRTKRISRDDWLKNIKRIRVQRHHEHGHHGHHGQKKSHSRHPRRRSTSLPSRKKLEP